MKWCDFDTMHVMKSEKLTIYTPTLQACRITQKTCSMYSSWCIQVFLDSNNKDSYCNELADNIHEILSAKIYMYSVCIIDCVQ